MACKFINGETWPKYLNMGKKTNSQSRSSNKESTTGRIEHAASDNNLPINIRKAECYILFCTLTKKIPCRQSTGPCM